jgi:hypothetical protein
MRARRERNRRGPIASRHAEPATTDSDTPGQGAAVTSTETVASNGSASIPAGVSAGENASGNTDVPAAAAVPAQAAAAPVVPAAVDGEAPVSASANASTNPNPAGKAGGRANVDQAEAAGKPKRAPRRPGRPKGPDRVALSVRILPHLDEQLTAEVEAQQLNPQTIVDQALTDYFARLDRARHRAGISASDNDGENAGEDGGGNAG